jgi:phosphatidylglycerol---prolipoprotein diacylglyceryl transferase
MYPNLYYAFKDLFGVEIPFLQMFQSFGFFVMLAFLSAAWCFAKELKRKQDEGFLQSTAKKVLKGKKPDLKDYLPSVIGGFLAGYKLVYIAMNFQDFLGNTQGFILSQDGNWLGGLLGAGIFGWLRYSDYQKEKKEFPTPQMVNVITQPHEHVGNMTLYAAIFGLLGAKLFDILEHPSSLADDFWGTVFSFSGLTMYGGLILGSTAVLMYARKQKLDLRHVIDACAPGLMLAYGVGRIGCQVAGDGDWGIVNAAPKPDWMNAFPDWMWSYSYPHNVNEVGVMIDGCVGKYCTVLPEPVYPTPLYEAIACILLFVVLWSVRKRVIVPGVLFCIYLIMNGVERFFIEKIRVNDVYNLAGISFTQAELIAVLLMIAGIVGIFFFRKKVPG